MDLFEVFLRKFRELIHGDKEMFLYDVLEDSVHYDWDDLDEKPSTREEAEALAEKIYREQHDDLMQFQSETYEGIEEAYIDAFVDRFFIRIYEKLCENLSDAEVEAMARKEWEKLDEIPINEDDAADMAVADFDVCEPEILKRLSK